MGSDTHTAEYDKNQVAKDLDSVITRIQHLSVTIRLMEDNLAILQERRGYLQCLLDLPKS